MTNDINEVYTAIQTVKDKKQIIMEPKMKPMYVYGIEKEFKKIHMSANNFQINEKHSKLDLLSCKGTCKQYAADHPGYYHDKKW